jgi:hypothetical protein
LDQDKTVYFIDSKLEDDSEASEAEAMLKTSHLMPILD